MIPEKYFKIVIVLIICGAIFLWLNFYIFHNLDENTGKYFGASKKIINFGQLDKVDIIIDQEDLSEVNINKLKLGPMDLIFGSTEENGWMFIVDSENLEVVSWNAGRTKPLLGQLFEGDITDFVVWEEDGNLIILACQAYPAEIYRYVIAISKPGLPDVTNLQGELVYQNIQWERVMAIERGGLDTTSKMIVAGSYKNAELIKSLDGGLSWNAINYFDGDSHLDSNRHKDKLTRGAAFSSIHYINDTWFAFLYHAFLLESESPWDFGYRHFVNGILYSQDGGTTWKLAEVEKNSYLPESFLREIENYKEANYLHPKLYGLVGEVAESLVGLRGGRLIINTGPDNFLEKPFGGRVLVSNDNGETWQETFNFQKYTDLTLALFKNDFVLAGTMTKGYSTDLNFMASGEIWISNDGGNRFSFLKRVIETNKGSSFRGSNGLYVAGVSAIASTENGLFIGTVNEGEKAELFYLPIIK